MRISRISKVVFVCLLSLAVTTPAVAWRQNQPMGARTGVEGQGIPGYFNPRTGMFTARAQTPVANVTGTTPVIFRLVFNFNIEFNDQSGSSTIACSVSVSPSGDSSGLFPFESATSLSADGGKTCQVTILAQWNLANPNTDTVFINYDIAALQAVQGTLQTFRDSSSNLPNVPMPSNGQTVTEPTITVVL